MKLEELINQNYSKLNENDIYIFKYILKNKKTCSNLVITELANRCNVSKTTIVRCVKKLGFQGYSEFKVHLKWEENDVHIEENNNVENLLKEVNQTVNYIKDKNFDKICKLIYNAKKIFVYGTGAAQNVVAQALKHSFLAAHKYLFTIESAQDFNILIDSITDNDIIIIISLSGNSDSLQKLINRLSLLKIEYISITKLVNNKLSTSTPYNLYATTSEFILDNGHNYNCFTMYYILIEALFRHYIEYEKQQKNKIS